MRIVKFTVPLDRKKVKADLERLARAVGVPTRNLEVGVMATRKRASHGHIRPYGTNGRIWTKRSGKWLPTSAYILIRYPIGHEKVRKYFWKHGGGDKFKPEHKIDGIEPYNAMLIVWLHELCHFLQKEASRPFSEPECDMFALHWAKQFNLLPPLSNENVLSGIQGHASSLPENIRIQNPGEEPRTSFGLRLEEAQNGATVQA